ncbi:MAG TPA: 50S ribosomal protein L24 [Candidatus Acidoferrales bacterium]|nr:50S ribosomal protein L24 [Candidatus Acidoferrales bacterium]
MSNRQEQVVRHSGTIRKNDQVRVMAGRDKGKTGRVLSVDPAGKRVTVEHAGMVKRHTRPNPQKNVKGGILEREAPIAISNVMVVCPACNKHTRVGHRILSDGTKVRICRRCDTTLEK